MYVRKPRASVMAARPEPAPAPAKRAVAGPTVDAPLPPGAKLEAPLATARPADIAALVAGRHRDPHTFLGAHAAPDGRGTIIRAWFPDDTRPITVETPGRPAKGRRPASPPRQVPMVKVAEPGLYEARLPDPPGFAYRYALQGADGFVERREDPYRFPISIGELDRWLFGEGKPESVTKVLGAALTEVDGVKGYRFGVWAPNAQRVSVVGEFNAWDGRRHPMRKLGDSGVFELFLPELAPGQRYQLELVGPKGEVFLRSDPCATETELRPGTASVLPSPTAHVWGDDAWMKARAKTDPTKAPVSTYELHLGSWMRKEDGSFATYREIADALVPYVTERGFTHVELMPVTEHPFDGSWGYQCTGYYAPTRRHGSPDDLAYLVDRLHQADVGVILDWVPGHFPKDAHGLIGFDGTDLFDHHDPRRGEHKDWGTRIFNYGRPEVETFLAGSALHLLERFHFDGLRVDGVASMLYRDYSREPGQWVPNHKGGNEDFEAVGFLQRLNQRIHQRLPGVMTIAEESTSWPGVTRPVEGHGPAEKHPCAAGRRPEHAGPGAAESGERSATDSAAARNLGFDLKWNMGWMNDTLSWFARPHDRRGAELDTLTNTLLWANSERFVAALSHDEVVHGKRSLLEKMPGDDWQKHANLRLLFSYMWSYPGHKLLFMGGELGQRHEWRFAEGLDFARLEDPKSAGLSKLLTDLNALYVRAPALTETQFAPGGFDLVFRDTDNGAIGISRQAGDARLLFAHNLTPKVHHEYRIGVDLPGEYREVLSSDDAGYGGSGVKNDAVVADPRPKHGKPYSIRVTLPPLGTAVFERA